MLSDKILERLLSFTDEEINNLNGKNTVDKSIFISNESHVVDCDKMMSSQQKLFVRKHTRFIDYPCHKHNYIELMYVYGGQMTHTINDKDITIHEGELLLLNQSIEHSIHCCSENDIIFNFIIKPEFLSFLSHLLEENNDVSNFIFDTLYSYENDGEYLLFKVHDDIRVKSYIESIITSIYEPKLYNELELKLLVGLLLTELMNHPEDIESYTGNSYEKIIGSTILKYIALHYQDASLSDLSKIIHQPDYKICKVIKKQTGMTFTQLLQEERLKAAEKLLKSTDMSMLDIMQEVGYENISYFYKIFKK
ncbi:MAG: AraC family transcriptional regulator, partial [Coprobacillus sp.]